MKLNAGRTFGGARKATIALTVAAFIARSVHELDERSRPPALDVPFVPTPPQVVDAMLELAEAGPGDVLVDLGCGDGRIAIEAARRGAYAVGVDADQLRIEDAQDAARRAGVGGQATFIRGNLFTARLDEATVVTLYLVRRINLELRPRLLKELKPGTRVVSHTFDMGDWKPDRVVAIGFRQVFLWVVPALVGGEWRGGGSGLTRLSLQQDYQYVTGSAQVEGETIGIVNGRVHGTAIELNLTNGWAFEGHVIADRIEGELSRSGDALTHAWCGTRVHNPSRIIGATRQRPEGRPAS